MWILPKNYQLTNPQTSLAFVPDTVASKEDLTLLESTIESSLMWRSKPSPLQTWSRRWNRVSWMPPLFGRILKPSQHTSFETALTSSLAATRANRLARLEGERERKIPDISGHTSDDMSEQLTLFSASSKTSKDTSRLDSTTSSAIWKKMVTTQRSEYSQRLKSARLTRESESSSWATPNTMDYLPPKAEETLRRQAQTVRKGRSRPSNLREQVNPRAMEIYKEELYPTPSATPYGNNQGGAAGRTGKVRHSLESMARQNLWPTPRASEYKDCGAVGSKSHTHMDKRSYLCAKAKDPAQPTGCLNPTWVEWLMGVPTGWTELGSWGTE